MNITQPFGKYGEESLEKVNIKDYDEGYWIAFFVVELIFLSLAIALSLLSCGRIKREIEVREHESDRISRKDVHLRNNIEYEKARAYVNTELDIKSAVRTNVIFNENNKEGGKNHHNERKYCFCFKCPCCEKFGNYIVIVISVIILIFDLYTFISEAIVMKNSRFLGTQFIVYENAYIINSNFLIFDD